MNFEELVEIVRNSGAIGAGGAGFPSYAKLNKKIDTVILNCAECEPLFKMHRQLLARNAHEIVSALDLLAQIVGAEQFIVAVKKKYKKTVEAVENALADYEKGKLSLLPEVYPIGDEVILIYETTGRRVPPGNIPISVGVCVFNVETMLNIYNAVNGNGAVTSKYVTVAGEVKNPATYCVPIGTTFGELIELSGGATVSNFAVLKGGPMTGNLSSSCDVVTKNTNGILVFPENHPVIMKRRTKTTINAARAKSVCCQCRMCTDLCPRNLLGMPVRPNVFMDAIANGATGNTKAITDAMYCVSCGLCELYSCTQGLTPRSLISEFKGRMRAEGVTIEKFDKPQSPVSPAREYRRVPMNRLKERLGLIKYDRPANITDVPVMPKRVKLLLSQGIGAPACPCVSKGDTVSCGQLIARAAEGLSVPLHASIDGKVIEVTGKYILIDSM